ncbi:MAG TPA: hypothetical protein VGN05_03710 [Parvibaculum sp.]|jgi:hypothetical protein
MKTLKTAAILSALSVALIATSVRAGDAPAVSKLNGSVSLSGIYHHQDNLSEGLDGMLSGSLSVPLTHSFGFQADATAATTDDDGAAAIGGHLFWRDPAKGLIGLTGAYATFPNVGGTVDMNITRFGGEAEYYLGDLTLAFSGGHENGNHTKDGFYGVAKAYWYANDNLRLGIGAAKNPLSNTAATLDLEYQPDFGVKSGMTFFAGSSVGNDNLVIAQTGIRFYFGEPKSLKRRNREDDPQPMTDEIFKQINPGSYAKYCAGEGPAQIKYPAVTCGVTPAYTPPI